MNPIKSKSTLLTISLKALLPVAGLFIFGPLCLLAQSGPPTNGLQLWLRADAGVSVNGSGGVTNWADQSTNGFNAILPAVATPPTYIANEPVLNNKPAIQFDDTQYLQLGSTLDIVGDMSCFVVMSLEPNVNDYRGIFDQGSATNAVPFPDQWLIYANYDHGGKIAVQRGDGKDTGYVLGTDYDVAFSDSPPATGRYISLAFTATGTNIAIFQDNVDFGVSGFPSTLSIAAGGVPMLFGARYGTSSGSPEANSLRGRIAELLIYNVSLSDTDRTNTSTYLANKYNLAYSVTCDLATTPANGSTIAAPATISATATTTAAGASITQVNFEANGITIASVTAPPYVVPISVLNPGTFTLTAVAVDNLGLLTKSAPVTLTVTGSAPTFTPGSKPRFVVGCQRRLDDQRQRRRHKLGRSIRQW
jgi:hypothetical protein